jgi:hypothetical protein
LTDEGSSRIETLRARLPPQLVDWFAREIDKGDAPQLHLVGLRGDDLERCFAAIAQRTARWNDRTFHIDDEGVDVTVQERPEVARLVAQRRASNACLGTEDIVVDGVQLPLVEMFLFPDEIQFFWWPDAGWTPDRVAAFFALLERLLALAPAASLQPDTRYPAGNRRTLADLIARVLGDPSRLAQM